MGQPDQQKCLAEGETALDKVPIYASYKKDFARCGGINNLSTELYLASRAVAEAGDVDVQVCFAVGFGRQDEDTGISGIGDYDADYRSLARQYIDAAFARGDWRIVQRFTRTQLFMGDGGIASVYPHGTMDMAYKMTRLLQMGATGSYADELAARLEAMKGDPRLTEQQIKEGDDWANATYAQYFAHASRLTKEPADLCG